MRAIPAMTVLAAVLAAAPALGDAERRLEASFDHRDGQKVHFEISIGEVRIEGVPGDRIRLEVFAKCRWGLSRCETVLEELTIESRVTDRRIQIELVGSRVWGKAKLEIEAVLTMPARAPLEVDMGVGELDLSGLESDVEVELGVGELRLEMPRERVRSASLDAGIGEARLTGAHERIEGRRALMLGSEVRWNDGPGDAHLDLEVGVGEISVRLR